MEILGIGASELIFIIIIALIVLGPKDMQKAGKTIGKWLRTIVTSDGWKAFQQTSRELRTLPNRLMREANEEVNKIGSDISEEVNKVGSDISKDINASDPTRARTGPMNVPQRSKPVPPTAPATQNPEPEKPDSAPLEPTNDNTESNT